MASKFGGQEVQSRFGGVPVDSTVAAAHIATLKPTKDLPEGRGAKAGGVSTGENSYNTILPMATAAMLGGPILGEGAALLPAGTFSKGLPAALREGSQGFFDAKSYGPAAAGTFIGNLIGGPKGAEYGAVAGALPYAAARAVRGFKQAMAAPESPMSQYSFNSLPMPSIKPRVEPEPVQYPAPPLRWNPQLPQAAAPPRVAPPPLQPNPFSAEPMPAPRNPVPPLRWNPKTATPDQPPIHIEGLGTVKLINPEAPTAGGSMPVTPFQPSWTKSNNSLHNTLQQMELPGSPAGSKAAPKTVTGLSKDVYDGKTPHELSSDELDALQEFIVKNKRLPKKGEL